LVTRGYDVRKSFKNGRNQILVTKSHTDNNPNLKITNILSSASAELYVKEPNFISHLTFKLHI